MILSSGIYCIINTLDNKIYLGSAKNIPKRWLEHQKSLANKSHPNKHLQRAYNKQASFEYKVLFYCDTSKLLFYEQRCLNYYWDGGSTCYNICKTAGSMLGFKHSTETKNKMATNRLGHLGVSHTEKTKQKLAKARLGKKASLETKVRMSNSRGTKQTHSKLSINEVKEIKALLASQLFTYTKIATFYSISRTTVSKIDKNLSWKVINDLA